MSTSSIAIIGGGVWVAALCAELVRASSIKHLDIRLHARDPSKLRRIAEHCRSLIVSLGRPDWSLRACTTTAEAVKGVNAIVLIVRVGGLAARSVDEEFPRQFGIAGDEGLGPGGYANALRTLPVLNDIAEKLVSSAPLATIFNLMAPLGLTTRLLLDCNLTAIGVCELPAVTERDLCAVMKRQGIRLNYAGLNHLGWFWPRPEDEGFLAAAIEGGLADAEVVESLGAIPLKYFYWLFNPLAAARLGLPAPVGRAGTLIDLTERVLRDFVENPHLPSRSLARRPMPWFENALVPMLLAQLGEASWSGFANVRSGGITNDLPAEAVVETRATLDGGRLIPFDWPEDIPPNVRAFLGRAGAAEELVYRAWRDNDPSCLAEALRTGPYHIDPTVIPALTQAVLAAANTVD